MDPSIVSFHSDPSLHALHQQSLELLTPALDATCTLASGAWASSPGDRVVIPTGVEVTLSGDWECEWLLLRGKLTFADGASLKIGTLVQDSPGVLDLGSGGRRIAATVTFADLDFAAADWSQLGRGAILMGEVSICGHAKTPWAKVAVNPRMGDTTLTFLLPPNGWNVGDELVIPGVKPARNRFSGTVGDDPEPIFRDQHERVTVTAVNGDVVTFAPPLAFDLHHQVPAGFNIAVANLTRSITFASENAERLRRGHVMFMAGGPQERTVAYCTFKDLGRTTATEHVTDPQLDANGSPRPETLTNVRGRYAPHNHKEGYDVHTHYRGVAIDGALKWAMSIHQSKATVDDCVSFDAEGSNFNTENGTEVGSFNRCLAVLARGYGFNNQSIKDVTNRSITGGFRDQVMAGTPALRQSIAPVGQDHGFTGDGFWLQGPLFDVNDCEAYGAMHDGFAWVQESLEKDAGGKPLQLPVAQIPPALAAELNVGAASSVPVGFVPFFGRDNNAVGCLAAYGMYAFPIRSPLPSVLTSGVNVNCLIGVFHYPLMNLSIVEDAEFHVMPGLLPDGKAPLLVARGFDSYNVAGGCTLKNCRFYGFHESVVLSQPEMSVVGERTVLAGWTNVRFQVTPFKDPIQRFLLQFPESAFGQPSPERLAEMGNPPLRNIVMIPQQGLAPGTERVWEQPDKTLTIYETALAPPEAVEYPGIVGAKVVIEEHEPDHSEEIAALEQRRAELVAERQGLVGRLAGIDAELADIEARLAELGQ